MKIILIVKFGITLDNKKKAGSYESANFVYIPQWQVVPIGESRNSLHI